MFTFLLVVHAIIAASLVAVILVQRSEGGGLGMGGSPSGLMSARGAADFLTRATGVLATLFVLMSIGLAAFASVTRAPSRIDTSLARKQTALPAPALGGGGTAAGGDPLAAVPGPSGAPGVPAPLAMPFAGANTAAPATDDGSARNRKKTSDRSSDDGSDKASGTAKAENRDTSSKPKKHDRAADAPGSVPPPIALVPLRSTPKAGTLAPAEPVKPSVPASTPSTPPPAPPPSAASGAGNAPPASAPAGGGGNSSQP